MSRRVSLLARVDQIVAKGDWSRERAQQRQAHHVHTRTSDKRGKRLLGTQATIEYYSHQLKKQDKAPKTPQNAEDARRLAVALGEEAKKEAASLAQAKIAEHFPKTSAKLKKRSPPPAKSTAL